MISEITQARPGLSPFFTLCFLLNIFSFFLNFEEDFLSLVSEVSITMLSTLAWGGLLVFPVALDWGLGENI